jgi:hypothetical protein
VVALFVSLRIIRLRQMAAIYRQAFGELLLIIATTAVIVAAMIEQGVAIGIVPSLSNLNGLRPHALIGANGYQVGRWSNPEEVRFGSRGVNLTASICFLGWPR